jgi:hypothetical protein
LAELSKAAYPQQGRRHPQEEGLEPITFLEQQIPVLHQDLGGFEKGRQAQEDKKGERDQVSDKDGQGHPG